ncbi:amino acid adenylation domain-containing protein [Kitasatospora sp. NPDC057223]|uniref:amino acid adenylation domain-containing protein n=1 Tax=Kitasatospora sp. NPDC057223 TaxID=3346055 RepID=UPI00363AC8E0
MPDAPEPDPRVRSHPLTADQRRLWFLGQLHPEDAGFNMYLVRRWTGPLDLPALRAALTRLVARHEILRTRFALAGEEPVQLVDPAGPVAIDSEQLPTVAGETPEQLEARFTEAVAPHVNAPFDLAGRPPLRAVVLHADEQDHAVCITLHHIISDGWSARTMWRELLALYRDELGEAPAGLPEPTLQYGDYARAEQARTTAAGAAEEAFRHWYDRLAGTAPLRLPADHPRPAAPAHPAGFVDLVLDAELTAGLDRLAREQRCTPFMVLLAVYQTVLARWTGQDDFTVGTPLAGRNEVAHEALLGYFTRTAVIRADLTGEPDFRTVLRRVRSATMAALGHQDVPVERLANALDLPNLPGVPPLYQTLFVLQSQHELAGTGADPVPAGVRTGDLDSGFRQAKADVMLDSWRSGDGLTLSFCFDLEVFERPTVEALARRCRTLLTRVVEDPELPVHGDWLLGPDERAALLAQGAGPALTAAARPVLERFAEQVAARPGADALEYDGEILSYAELDRRSTLLAQLIGPQAGRAVAVRIEPSFALVTALLAIWKAGGGYLPLDGAHPAERQRLMAAEAGAGLLLTAGDTPDLGLPVLALPADWAAAGRAAPAGAPLPGSDPAGAAYILYTSGSTGTPKGVLVEHGALAERVDWMAGDGYALGPGDRIVQFASTGFDTHAEEIWPALAAGACCVLLPGGGRMLPDLLRSPRGAAVTVLDLPTAYWQELVALGADAPWPAALRLVILGGSEAGAAAVAAWRERHGDRVRLVNTYGPTEATVIVTSAGLGAADALRRPSLGRPLPGVRCYVLDARRGLLPAGSEGELFLGGAGLARGYVGRPELTAAHFLPDPFAGPAAGPDARMYRTGDRVRWRADGGLDFLGRADDQVKIRGYRIEPAEIETALAAHPAVARAAVVVREGRRLTGYAVPRQGAAPSPAALREHLAARLPAFMVPDALVVVPALPLTANGKLDLAALPDPDPGIGNEYLAPRTDAELLVAELWQEVLGVPKVGALDDFFELGGDSLLVTRVAARIRSTVGLDVPIRDVFESPTPAALAARIEALLIAEIDALSDAEAAGHLSG